MPRLTTPSNLTKPEKTAFRRIVKRLKAVDIDPATRVEILTDFIQIEARIVALRQDEAKGSDMAITRALNVATAERRRLHAELFKGARRVPKPTLEDLEEQEKLAAGHAKWRELLGDNYWVPGLPPV
jgi:hypothetical protein